MLTVIKEINPASPVFKKLRPGERLISINGHPVKDVLDYKYYSYDAELLIGVKTGGGSDKLVLARKDRGDELGLEFETYLMDRARSCANKCVFCFVDQLPEGMRESLYFKDDDARLSFLTGNYITMTNLSQREIQRIVDMKVSPINISVHSTVPQLRCELLGHRGAGNCMNIMQKFAESGIIMNCQIVCCLGLNDGEALKRTMDDLSGLYPCVSSVSIVPVGLTKHREGLYPLKPFDMERALATIRDVESFSEKCLREKGSRIFFCSDEMYIKAGLPLPEDDFYEGYPQLENGVGMMRLLITEFCEKLEKVPGGQRPESFSIATGVSAGPFIQNLMETAAQKCDNIEFKVHVINNDFFGHTINVAGLITGGDLIKQLRGKELGKKLMIPGNMLRSGEEVFLDDITVQDVQKVLGVPVKPVNQNGAELVEAIFDK